MYKKCIYLISLVFLLGMVVDASAVDRNWTNGNGNRLWTTAANWSGSVVPTSADKAGIRNQAILGPIIQSGMTAVANQIVVGDFSSTNDTLTMTGGSLTTSGTNAWVILGYGAANKGTFTISAGTVSTPDNFFVGFNGKGYVQMTGGSITVGLNFGIAKNTGSIADVNLYGGTITVNGTFTMSSGGGLDITTGTLIVNGDVTTLINTYITNGWITAYGGAGTVNVSYNTPNVGKTTVTATPAGPPGQAATPNPANGATGVSITNDLSWTAGSGATSHDVYFGTTSPGTFIGNQTATTYDTGTMAYSTTYYWRIDEKNANGTTTGVVWSFTTAAPSPPGQAASPSPANGATGVNTTADLSWTAGSGATSHDVYFGTTSPGTFQGNQTATTFDTGTMANSTTYYWRIDEKNAGGTTTGVVWSFTTAAAPQPPGQATNPSPATGATNVSTTTDLSWTAGSGATSHDVYFGTASPGTFRGNQTATTYDTGTMANSTTYYWRIDEKNAVGTTTGVVWSFTTVAAGLSDTTDDLTGTISARGENLPNEGMAKAFDNLTSTKWLDFSPTGSWIQYKYVGSDTSVVTQYTLTSANDAQERDPTNWNLLGSNNGGSSWVTLDTRTGVLFTARFQKLTFDFTNSTGYNIYRLSITALRGPAPNSVQLAEIEFIGTPHTPPAPTPPGQAANPSPATGATSVSITADLSWTAGSGTTSHDVYFGTTSPGTFIGNQTAATFDTGTMAYSTTYYWRIDEKNAVGTTTGVVWSFTTAATLPPPGQATTPNPANAATGIGITNDLSWTAGTGATSHDVYFGTASPGTLRGNQTATTYDTGTMAYSTTYYWRINEINASGTTTGVVWSFTTAAATGVDRNWTNTNGNRLWTTAANWSGSVVPTGADKAAVRNSAILGPIIQAGMNAVANTIVVGDWSSTNDTLTMTGGTLTTNSWFVLAYGPTTNRGTFTLSGGTVNVNDPTGGMYVGNTGTSIGTLDMTGGAINVVTTFGIAQVAGSTGTVYLDGGTITCGALNMTTNGRLDITAGTLIVNGDVTTLINTYRSNGWLTAYGGSGTWNIDYNTRNPGKTTVTAEPSLLPGIATAPNPANGASAVATTNDLSWTAGYSATSHNVYFGTTSPGTSRGNQTATTYDTGTMANNTTYYWRIDEQNANGITTGTVWSFTTQGTVVVNRRKGPYLIYPNNNTQMRVLWQVDVTAGCTIAWGTDTSYSTGNAGTTEYGTDHQHSYTIGSLTPGTKYYYRVTGGSNNWTGNFYAAPAATATNVKFFMYGDTRTNGGSNNTDCGRMISTYTADAAYQTMVLHAGDWVNADSEADYTSQWYNYTWTNIVNATANMAFMGCIGNHEGGASIFMKYHPFPFVAARYFSFDYGPVHVAVVDQYTTYTSGSAQYNWLVSDLSGSTKPWKIIVLHQPAWNAGGSHGNDGTAQSVIQPLAQTYGVQIVLGGHNHLYSRCAVPLNGTHTIQHITNGVGGAPYYSYDAGQPYVVAGIGNTLVVCQVAISGNTLTCTTVRADNGNVVDTLTIDRTTW